MFVFRHKNQLQFRPDLITSPCASSILPPPPSTPQNVCGGMRQPPLRLLQLLFFIIFIWIYFVLFGLFIFWYEWASFPCHPSHVCCGRNQTELQETFFMFLFFCGGGREKNWCQTVTVVWSHACWSCAGLCLDFYFLFFPFSLSFACFCELVYDDCIAPWLHLFSPRHLWGFICKKKEKREKEKKVWTSASIRHFPLIKPRSSIIFLHASSEALWGGKKRTLWDKKKNPVVLSIDLYWQTATPSRWASSVYLAETIFPD